jgi:hypothetical protein
MMKQRFGVVSVVLLLGFLASCQRVPEKRYEMQGKVV